VNRRFTQTATIRLTQDQDRKLKIASLAYGLTISQVVRKFLSPLWDLPEAKIMVSGMMEDMRKPKP